MKWLRNLSIKHKVIWIVLIVSFAVACVAILFYFFVDMKNYKEGIKENIAIETRLIGAYCVSPLVFHHSNKALEVFSKLKVLDYIERGVLFDEKGNIFASYSKEGRNTVWPQFRREAFYSNQGNILEIYEPINYEGNYYGSVYLQCRIDLYDHIKSSIKFLSLLLVGLTFLSFLLALVLHKYISVPVFQLIRITDKVSKEKDYSVRIKQSYNDEIGILIDKYNEMLAEIQRHNIARDMAEKEIRKLNYELEERVKERTQELASVNNELRDFAYITSHDLKSPLRGISQVSQWLLSDYSEKFDSNGKQLLRLLQDRVARMNKLIDNILEYSRIGRKEVDNVNIDMNKLVDGVLDILPIPENFEIIKEDSLPSFYGNKTRIEQIFLNLLSNAIRYNDKEKGVVHIGHELDGKYLKISIEDNGPGIHKKYQKKIFGIFQVLDSRKDGESTGVGLAIVKKIVELYKGTVWVESDEGKGAKFCFTLKLKVSHEIKETDINS